MSRISAKRSAAFAHRTEADPSDNATLVALAGITDALKAEADALSELDARLEQAGAVGVRQSGLCSPSA